MDMAGRMGWVAGRYCWLVISLLELGVRVCGGCGGRGDGVQTTKGSSTAST
jgi:hypothetical protein